MHRQRAAHVRRHVRGSLLSEPRLAGRLALVTGGSRGIGAAIAVRLAAEGAAVAVNYRADARAAQRVVAAIAAAGGRALAIAGDVTQLDNVAALVGRCGAALGGLDLLVNNAGTAVTGAALETTPATLDVALRIAVHAPLACSQAAADLLARSGRGAIVNVSSVGALGTAVANLAAYQVAKSALNMLTKRLAFELGPRGVRVNAVCPGLVETDMAEATRDVEAFAAMRADARRTTMLGRIGAPADIAGVVAFLAGNDAAFMTGQVLTVDGGRLDFLSRSG